ncbi:MAG: PIN domain-containing protein [Candidatus Lokiarchaeota archaeon]|nr:PIN domain-containing protein [Candidatus Harpocratesius repetitus]
MSHLPPFHLDDFTYYGSIFDVIENGEKVLQHITNYCCEYPVNNFLTPATNYNAFFRFAGKLNIPFRYYNKFTIFKAPSELKNDLNPFIKIIKKFEKNHKKQASRVDCLIGLYAMIYHWKVISYDNDLLLGLQNELNIEVDQAFEIKRLHLSGSFILDTNVLIYILNNNKMHAHFIKDIFLDEKIHLIIPVCVLEEFERVQKSIKNSNLKKIKVNQNSRKTIDKKHKNQKNHKNNKNHTNFSNYDINERNIFKGKHNRRYGKKNRSKRHFRTNFDRYNNYIR